MKTTNSKTQPVQSRLDRENIIRLNTIAKSKGISLSLLVRMILIEYVEVKNGKL